METKMFDYATMKAYTITIQDCTQPTQHKIIQVLRSALENIYEDHDIDEEVAIQITLDALRHVGYLK